MTSISTDLRERLQDAQKALKLTAGQLAAELRITPEWMSKIVRGHVKGSDDIRLRLDELLRQRGVEPGSTKRVEPTLYPPAQGAAADALRTEARRLFDHVIAATRDDPARLGWVVEQLRIHLRKPETWEEPETPAQIAARLGLPTMGRPTQQGTGERSPTVPLKKSGAA